MKSKMYSGSYEIIDSNSTILYNGNSNLKICIEIDEISFYFNIIFINDKSNESYFKGSIVEGNNIEIKCYNFNYVFGNVTPSPIEICLKNGEKLFLNISVKPIGGNKIINYTIYK